MEEDQRIVIAGGGRVGLSAAKNLENKGNDVLIIEQDDSRCEVAMENTRASVINGDVTDPSILQQANIDDADAFLALTGESGSNLSACLLVDRFADDIRTVMRVDTDKKSVQYDDIVDDVIYPEFIGGQRAADLVRDVVNTGAPFEGSNLRLVEVEVPAGAPANGVALDDLALPASTRVVCSETEPADGDTVIEAGTRYLVVTSEADLEDALQLLRG